MLKMKQKVGSGASAFTSVASKIKRVTASTVLDARSALKDVLTLKENSNNILHEKLHALNKNKNVDKNTGGLLNGRMLLEFQQEEMDHFFDPVGWSNCGDCLRFLLPELYHCDDYDKPDLMGLLAEQFKRQKEERSKLREQVIRNYSMPVNGLLFYEEWFQYWTSVIIKYIGFIETGEAKDPHDKMACVYFSRWLLNNILFELYDENSKPSLSEGRLREGVLKTRNALTTLDTDHSDLLKELEKRPFERAANERAANERAANERAANEISNYANKFKKEFKSWSNEVIKEFMGIDSKDGKKEEKEEKEEKECRMNDGKKCREQLLELMKADVEVASAQEEEDQEKLKIKINKKEVKLFAEKELNRLLLKSPLLAGKDLDRISWENIVNESKNIDSPESYNKLFENICGGIYEIILDFKQSFLMHLPKKNLDQKDSDFSSLVDSLSGPLYYLRLRLKNEFKTSQPIYIKNYREKNITNFSETFVNEIFSIRTQKLSDNNQKVFADYTSNMKVDLVKVEDLNEELNTYLQEVKIFIAKANKELIAQDNNVLSGQFDSNGTQSSQVDYDSQFLAYQERFGRMKEEADNLIGQLKAKYQDVGNYSSANTLLSNINCVNDNQRCSILALHLRIKGAVDTRLSSSIKEHIDGFNEEFKSYVENKNKLAQAKAEALVLEHNKDNANANDNNKDNNKDKDNAISGRDSEPEAHSILALEVVGSPATNKSSASWRTYGGGGAALTSAIVLGACFAATPWGIPLAIGAGVALIVLAVCFKMRKSEDSCNLLHIFLHGPKTVVVEPEEGPALAS